VTHGDADFTFSPYKRDIGKKPKTGSHLSPRVTQLCCEGMIGKFALIEVQWSVVMIATRLESMCNVGSGMCRANLQAKTIFFLKVCNNTKEIASLRIAAVTKHSHKAFW